MHLCTFVKKKTFKLFLAVVVDKLLCNCNVHVLEDSRLKTAVACIAKNDNNAEGKVGGGWQGQGGKVLELFPCSHSDFGCQLCITRLEICCEWQL